MKFDLRTYVLGGEVLNSTMRANVPGVIVTQERKFTHLVPVADAVLTPSEPGDLIACWAIVGCMRDNLITIQQTFPGYTYTDLLSTKGKSQMFTYDSPLAALEWWADKLDMVIELEKQILNGKYVGLLLDLPHAAVVASALDWFVSRHRCRPPGLAEGLHLLEAQIQQHMQAAEGQPRDGTQNAVGLDSLPEADKRAVEVMRLFDESNFEFLGALGLAGPDESTDPDGDDDHLSEEDRALDEKHQYAPKAFNRMDDVDEELFANIQTARAVAPDGFREDDRRALDQFRMYVSQGAAAIPPLVKRWFLQSRGQSYQSLGERIFALGQGLSIESFPNAEIAKFREEEMAAARAREQRLAAEKKAGGRPQE